MPLKLGVFVLLLLAASLASAGPVPPLPYPYSGDWISWQPGFDVEVLPWGPNDCLFTTGCEPGMTAAFAEKPYPLTDYYVGVEDLYTAYIGPFTVLADSNQVYTVPFRVIHGEYWYVDTTGCCGYTAYLVAAYTASGTATVALEPTNILGSTGPYVLWGGNAPVVLTGTFQTTPEPATCTLALAGLLLVLLGTRRRPLAR